MLVSKYKRYLSGSDWVINTLDHLMKATTCAGNMSQVVLQFESALDENAVKQALIRFVKEFPVLEGSVRRDLALAPYWKIPAKTSRTPAFTVHRVAGSGIASFLPYLETSINTPFRSKRDHLAFHLLTGETQTLLAMVFDHSVFDARGAELFLDHFERSLNGAVPVAGDIAFASTRALSQWSRKFLAGRTVNRRIIALSKSTPEALPLPEGRKRGYRYHLLSFNEEETRRIYERAYEEAGYLMESPYLLSVIIQTMHELFPGRRDGSTYLVPVTMDLRPGLDAQQEIFFNYVSYLFYQVPAETLCDSKGLIALLKQQMYDQVKSGFPRDLAEASLLTRIAPLPVLGKLLHLPLKGKMATFAFSHLGRTSYQHASFMGAQVAGMFHMPRVPVPPGLGFFSNLYNNKLNLVIAHLDGMLDKERLRLLEEGIRGRFSAVKTA